MIFHPFFHCLSIKTPPLPPPVRSPLGYVYPRRVLPIKHPKGGEEWPNYYFPSPSVQIISPALLALDDRTPFKGTRQHQGPPTQQSNSSLERVAWVGDGQGSFN